MLAYSLVQPVFYEDKKSDNPKNKRIGCYVCTVPYCAVQYIMNKEKVGWTMDRILVLQ